MLHRILLPLVLLFAMRAPTQLQPISILDWRRQECGHERHDGRLLLRSSPSLPHWPSSRNPASFLEAEHSREDENPRRRFQGHSRLVLLPALLARPAVHGAGGPLEAGGKGLISGRDHVSMSSDCFPCLAPYCSPNLCHDSFRSNLEFRLKVSGIFFVSRFGL